MDGEFRLMKGSKSMDDDGRPFIKLEKPEHALSTESDFSDSDQEKPKSIIRKSRYDSLLITFIHVSLIFFHYSSNGQHGEPSSSRKSILIRRHSEPSSPEDACSSSRGSECLSGHGVDSSNSHLASAASTIASVHIGGAADDAITILVECTRFIVNPAIFRSHPETMLGRMFSLNSLASSITRPNERGEYEITENVSAPCFRAILDFYKDGIIRCPEAVPVQELRDACDYFLIPFNAETVKCQNLRSLLQEISNQGAKEQFSQFVDSLVLPVLVEIAQQGEREGHIVVLAEDDQFQWDDVYPPPLGEEPSQIIRNDQLYRFFRYVENRDVAKISLKERGFKKVRIGVEGFPTTLEKVKKKTAGRIEVIYNYIQRAFIHMSWEEEDSKSRHVDFQCIRLKARTNPAPLAVAAADTEQDVAVVQQAVVDNIIDPSANASDQSQQQSNQNVVDRNLETAAAAAAAASGAAIPNEPSETSPTTRVHIVAVPSEQSSGVVSRATSESSNNPVGTPSINRVTRPTSSSTNDSSSSATVNSNSIYTPSKMNGEENK